MLPTARFRGPEYVRFGLLSLILTNSRETNLAKLWDDVIANMENGPRTRRVGKKTRELIGL